MDARDRLIIALDVPSASQAQKIVSTLGDTLTFYKVGLQLFTAEGPAIVRNLVAGGKKVFLDLKLHDIPNTVASAVQSAAELGVAMLSVHAGGGGKMLEAATRSASESRTKPMVLAVTVLTSLGEGDLQETGVSSGAGEHVSRLAELAKRSGCGGVVSSPLEAAALRRQLGPAMAIVTPGVRPAGAEKGDQARTATATEAISAGASHIVVGRPITGAADAASAARAVIQEIENVLKVKGRR